VNERQQYQKGGSGSSSSAASARRTHSIGIFVTTTWPALDALQLPVHLGAPLEQRSQGGFEGHLCLASQRHDPLLVQDAGQQVEGEGELRRREEAGSGWLASRLICSFRLD
jgi:hypothetical protein